MNSFKTILMCFLLSILFTSKLNAQAVMPNETSALIPAFQVNDNGGNTIQDNSAIAADKNGNFIAVWEDRRDEFNYDLDLGYDAGMGGDIYFQRLDSDGNLIGTNIKVNDDDTFMGQHLPAIAASGKGTFIVVWLDGREDVFDEDIFYIYAQIFNEAGTPLGANFKVNQQGNNREIYEYFSSDVAADASGNFVVTWEEMQNDTLKIFAQRFSDDGSAQGSNFVVNNFPNSEDNRMPQIAMSATGAFAITWIGEYRDDRYSDVYAQWYSADGTAQGSNVIVDDYTVEEVYIDFPKIGVDQLGNFLIAWKDARVNYHEQALYGQWFTINGSRLGNNFRINEEQSTLDSYSDLVSLAVAPDGSFCAAWFNPQTTRLSARRFSSDSTARGNSFSISPDPGVSKPAKQPDMAINGDGKVVVTWTDESDYSAVSYNNYFSDIFAQRIENDSTLLTKPIELNDDTGSGLQQNPSIAIDAEGNFTVVWEDPRNDISDIYMRRYTHEGTMLGEQVRVNDDVYGQRNKTPAIAADPGGVNLIVWEDQRGREPLIYGQFYAADGSAIDSNFVIDNGIGLGYYYKPQVAAMGNGLFIVTWQISFYDIGAQIYSVENGPVGSGFYVNDLKDWQRRINPAVAANDSGTFVIAWEDKRNGNADIYAQRYDRDGQTVGNNFKVNNSGSWGTYPSLAFKKDGVLNIIFAGDKIHGQRYSADGTTVGANYSISEAAGPNTFYRNTNIAVAESGKFIVSWEFVSDENFTTNIFAQRLSDGGTYLGDEFILIDSPTEKTLQHNVQVWGNRIYTTWIDNNYMGTSWDIFANVLDFDNPNATQIEGRPTVASDFELHQNYPNPFNPQTTIRYQIPQSGKVKLTVFNLVGQVVSTLVDGPQNSGKYAVPFNAVDISSGVYFYRLETAGKAFTRRMLLLK